LKAKGSRQKRNEDSALIPMGSDEGGTGHFVVETVDGQTPSPMSNKRDA